MRLDGFVILVITLLRCHQARADPASKPSEAQLALALSSPVSRRLGCHQPERINVSLPRRAGSSSPATRPRSSARPAGGLASTAGLVSASGLFGGWCRRMSAGLSLAELSLRSAAPSALWPVRLYPRRRCTADIFGPVVPLSSLGDTDRLRRQLDHRRASEIWSGVSVRFAALRGQIFRFAHFPPGHQKFAQCVYFLVRSRLSRSEMRARDRVPGTVSPTSAGCLRSGGFGSVGLPIWRGVSAGIPHDSPSEEPQTPAGSAEQRREHRAQSPRKWAPTFRCVGMDPGRAKRCYCVSAGIFCVRLALGRIGRSLGVQQAQAVLQRSPPGTTLRTVWKARSARKLGLRVIRPLVLPSPAGRGASSVPFAHTTAGSRTLMTRREGTCDRPRQTRGGRTSDGPPRSILEQI
jgi:hypothetical protein